MKLEKTPYLKQLLRTTFNFILHYEKERHKNVNSWIMIAVHSSVAKKLFLAINAI